MTWILIALTLWCVIAVLAVSLLAAAGHADRDGAREEGEPEPESPEPRGLSNGPEPGQLR